MSIAQFVPGFTTDSPWLTLAFVYWPIALAPFLFTWLLPRLMGYRRGGMAWIGLVISVVLTGVLGAGVVSETWTARYAGLHPWLYGVFYVYALAGLALCGVGIHDGKRSAIWGLLGVLSLTLAAVADTVIWLGWARGIAWVPWGFIGFVPCVLVAVLRKPADRPPEPDRERAAAIAANNRTRRSRSIPRKLLREGNVHLLPIYYLLTLSDLGREGIRNSGSYRFADHIYRNAPSGRTFLGRWLDRRMLNSPATTAFRHRYERARDEVGRAIVKWAETAGPDERFRMLAIPCGIPRDFVELVRRLQHERPAVLERLEYVGMDLDPELLRLAGEHTRGQHVASIEFVEGNALLPDDYPAGEFRAVVSTGLCEFLSDEQILYFFRNVHAKLVPGGTFFTSATQYDRMGEFLMEMIELHTNYRSTSQLEGLLRELDWSRIVLTQDDSGLQTFAVAVK